MTKQRSGVRYRKGDAGAVGSASARLRCLVRRPPTNREQRIGAASGKLAVAGTRRTSICGLRPRARRASSATPTPNGPSPTGESGGRGGRGMASLVSETQPKRSRAPSAGALKTKYPSGYQPKEGARKGRPDERKERLSSGKRHPGPQPGRRAPPPPTTTRPHRDSRHGLDSDMAPQGQQGPAWGPGKRADRPQRCCGARGRARPTGSQRARDARGR